MTSQRIFICNLPTGVTLESVKGFLDRHNLSHWNVEIVKNRTFGFLTPIIPPNSPPEFIQRLVSQTLSLDGSTFDDSGRKIVVKLEIPKDRTSKDSKGSKGKVKSMEKDDNVPSSEQRPLTTSQSNLTQLDRVTSLTGPPILRSKVPIVDIGANLTSHRLLSRISSILQDAMTANLSHIVITGTSEKESLKAIEMCSRHSSDRLTLACTFGIHPHNATSSLGEYSTREEWFSAYEKSLTLALESGHVKALGEMGLDYDRMFSTISDQKFIFKSQLILARKNSLPIFLHIREKDSEPFLGAFRDFFEILKEFPDVKKCVHCYTNPDLNFLKELLDPKIDCFIGITGWICDPIRGLELSKILKLKLVPLNRLMIETDSPYLFPKTISKKDRNSKDNSNFPSLLGWVLEKVAKDYDETVEVIAQHTTDTALNFFNLRRKVNQT